MKKRKRRNFYIDSYKQIYIANIVTSNSNMITILTVPKSSHYVPVVSNYKNIKYMPRVNLINSIHKSIFSYYIYDIEFRLLNKDDEVDDSITKYLNDNLFGITIDY